MSLTSRNDSLTYTYTTHNIDIIIMLLPVFDIHLKLS